MRIAGTGPAVPLPGSLQIDGLNLPWVRLLVRNKVEDFDVRNPIFDAEFARAGTFGVEFEHFRRSLDDPDEVFAIESRERAEAFIADPASAKAEEESGVIDGAARFVE